MDRLERVLSVAESFGLSLFLDFWKGDNKLLQALLADAPGVPVFLDTPTGNAAALALAHRCGYVWGNNPRTWLKT
ncbi:hypothetical protein PN467_16175 [Microcystis aeruginosa CS-563/04]|jgi:hypothetical protein|nr:hypothetical protein [Microcystis aeruginosa CS-563/04]